jgi:catechol 2,3-dioxygenase-like lactoylglutathione lyase family enzyme
MIDHIGFAVRDIGRARAFYQKALAPLGIAALVDITPEQSGSGAHVGFGAAGKAFFWIDAGEAPGRGPGRGMHVAFAAPDRATVDAFYHAALLAGGADNGGPGLRPYYHPNYYGGFVLDLDGHNIEAVCYAPA